MHACISLYICHTPNFDTKSKKQKGTKHWKKYRSTAANQGLWQGTIYIHLRTVYLICTLVTYCTNTHLSCRLLLTPKSGSLIWVAPFVGLGAVWLEAKLPLAGFGSLRHPKRTRPDFRHATHFEQPVDQEHSRDTVRLRARLHA